MTQANSVGSPSQMSTTDVPTGSIAGALVADLPSYCAKPPIETVVFGWGVSEDSQLGLDSQEDTDRPSVIESLLGTSFSGFSFNRRPIVAGCRHTLAITEAGRVLSWGWNDRGTLGLGHRMKTAKPTMIEALKHERVVQLAAGGWHCVAVTEEGRVYAWGGNERLQCGENEGTRDICVPRLIAAVASLTVRMVSCGGMHSVALTTGGDVWQWGEPWGDFAIAVNRCPQQLHVSNIMSITSGAFHNLALNDTNEVLAWGTNDFGQLGTGDTAYTPQPRHTVGLSKVPIADIAAQGWHSLALSVKGEVYTWGRGEYGRLGLNDPKGASRLRPSKVPGLQSHTVIQAACGGSHTMVLTDAGHMFIWGRCDGGRMGFSTQSTVEAPHEIALPGGAERWHPICIAAGGRHSMCMALPRHTVTDHERRQSALSCFNELPQQFIMQPARVLASPGARQLSRSVDDPSNFGSLALRLSSSTAPVVQPNVFREPPETGETTRPEGAAQRSVLSPASNPTPDTGHRDSSIRAQHADGEEDSWPRSSQRGLVAREIESAKSRQRGSPRRGCLGAALGGPVEDVDTPRLGAGSSAGDASPPVQGRAKPGRSQSAAPEGYPLYSSDVLELLGQSQFTDGVEDKAEEPEMVRGDSAGSSVDSTDHLVSAGFALTDDKAEGEGLQASANETHDLGELGGGSDADIDLKSSRRMVFDGRLSRK